MVSTSPRTVTEEGSRPELRGVPGPRSSGVASEETNLSQLKGNAAPPAFCELSRARAELHLKAAEEL